MSHRKNRQRFVRRRLGCEQLEDRRMLATYLIDSLADSGPGTLREAITLANETQEVADTIVFDETLFESPQAILLDETLPTITDSLTIIGPGADLLAIDGQHGTDRVPSTEDGWTLLRVIAPSYKDVSVAVAELTFRNSEGVAIYSTRSNLELDSVVIQDNYGGGISVSSGQLSISGSEFHNNHSPRDGGAIYFKPEGRYDDPNYAVIDTSFFTGNHATDGGAIFVDYEHDNNSEEHPRSLVIERSTFVDNEADSQGGAVAFQNVRPFENLAPLITGSTFTSNVASSGAAIYTDGPTEIRHSTIYKHHVGSVEYAGAVFSENWSSLIVSHSIIAGTTGIESFADREVFRRDFGGRPEPFEVSGVLRQDPLVTYSIIGFGEWQVPTGNGNIIGRPGYNQADPNLGPLGYHGGPTPTYALMPGSMAIDAGDASLTPSPETTDQRGGVYRRIAGATSRIDIGAYEAQTAVTHAPGDFDGNGVFDTADYTIWRQSEGKTVAPNTQGDATGDGIVDETDHKLWRARYGDRYLLGQLVVNDLGSDTDHLGTIFDDRTTLAEAIFYANESRWIDTITFDASLSGQVIELTYNYSSYGHFYLLDDLTIDGSSLTDPIIISGPSLFLYAHSRTGYPRSGTLPLDTYANTRVKLSGLTVETAGGVVNVERGHHGRWNPLNDEPNIIIDRVHVRGGSGRIVSEGPILVVDSTIEPSWSYEGIGLGVIHSRSRVTLIRSEISGGSGGVSVDEEMRFRYNGIPFDFRLREVPTIKLIDSTIRGTTDRPAVIGRGDISIVRSHIDNNHYGGIVAYPYELEWRGEVFYSQPVSLVDSTVSGNTLPDFVEFHEDIGFATSAGIGTASGLTAIRSRIENNTNYHSSGGGIASQTTVRLYETVVAGNYAPFAGGVFVRGDFPLGQDEYTPYVGLELVNSVVADNRSSFSAGIFVGGGQVHVLRSSITSNTFVDYPQYNGGPLVGGLYVGDNFSYTSGFFHKVIIEDSLVGRNGGQGVYVSSYLRRSYPVEIIRSRIVDNLGGGTSATHVVDSVISGNTGEVPLFYNSRNPDFFDRRSDGVGVQPPKDSALVRVERSTVANNGGVGVYGESLEIVDSKILNNLSGGILTPSTYSSTPVRLIDTEVSGNRWQPYSGYESGAAGITSYAVQLTRSIVANNVTTVPLEFAEDDSEYAGGVHARTVVAQSSSIASNRVEGSNAKGGGIYGDIVLLENSTVSDNLASGPGASGGGVFANAAEIYGSTISGNRAVGEQPFGGGIFVDQDLALYQSTVSGNQAEGDAARGGGISARRLREHGVIELHHSTVTNNSVVGNDVTGGGVSVVAIPHFQGTVVAGNHSAGSIPDLEVLSTEIGVNGEIHYSLIGDTSGSPIDSETGIGNLLDVDPMLGPLTDNGGPTKTHHPLPGSPLINAGDATRTAVPFTFRRSFDIEPLPPIEGLDDQRGAGHARIAHGPVGGAFRIDIGAVEVADQAAAVSLPPLEASEVSASLHSLESLHDPMPSARDAALSLLLLVEDTFVDPTEKEIVDKTRLDETPRNADALDAAYQFHGV